MKKSFLDMYALADEAFKKKILELDNIRCLQKTKRGSQYAESCEIYNIRGTRYSLIIRKDYWPQGICEFIDLRMSWQIKLKNKKEYAKVELSDILDSSLISNSAKEELVFNINVFLKID